MKVTFVGLATGACFLRASALAEVTEVGARPILFLLLTALLAPCDGQGGNLVTKTKMKTTKEKLLPAFASKAMCSEDEMNRNGRRRGCVHRNLPTRRFARKRWQYSYEDQFANHA